MYEKQECAKKAFKTVVECGLCSIEIVMYINQMFVIK